MKTKFLKNSLLSIFIVTLLISCSGEDGAVGPEGPQGEQGIQGEQGEQGETGTANVIYSDWISNGFSEGGGLLQKNFLLASATEISDLNVDLDTSAVLIYGRGNVLFTIGDDVLPLPYITGSNIRYTYSIDDGEIRIVGFTSDVSDNDFDLFDDYRYVIIPSGVSTGKSSIDYKKMTYQELITHFNITE